MLLLLLTILFYGSTCNRESDDCHSFITIINKSDNAIYTFTEDIYPDTLHFGYSSTTPALESKILPNDTGEAAELNNDCLEAHISSIFFPSDTLMIYIFDANIIETEDWGKIVTEYMVLKRYDLSLQDLKNMNWTITYP